MKPTSEQLDFISKKWTLQERSFVSQFNETFGCNITIAQWRFYKYEHRLIVQRQEKWTDYQVAFLLENYEKMGNVDIANHFGWSSERKKGEKKVWKKMRQMGLVRSKESLNRLKHDMGGRGWAAARAGRVSRGMPPHHSERIDGETWQRKKDKRWFIKVNEKIMPLAVYLWQRENGKIPKGKIVCFKDGDKGNCELSNLELRDRSEHARANSKISSNGLSFNYVAGMLTSGNPSLRKELKERYPQIIELNKQRLLNQRQFKNEKRQSNHAF